MSHLTVVAHDTEHQLRKKLRYAHDEAYKNRLKAVLLAIQGKKRYEIASQLTVDDKSVTTWLQRYNKEGTIALISNYGGRPAGSPKWDLDIRRTRERNRHWRLLVRSSDAGMDTEALQERYS